MYEHLQATVAAEVEVGVLIDGLRLVLRQVLHRQAERLLIILGELGLRWVGGTADARGQHVGHGLALGVLLDVDGTHLEHARLCAGRGLQVLLILAPFAAHEVERSEAQHDGLLESGEEHAHEADGGEVVDGSHLLLILGERYAILIPTDGERVAVAQLGIIVTMVDDVGVFRLHAAVVGLQLVVADGDAILIVALILVERIVLVDVLHVGAGLVAAVVAFGLVVGRRRVALRVIDALVAVHDGAPLTVEVGAAEVVVVVAGGVLAPGLDERVVLHDGADGVEPLAVGAEGALLLVGQTVQSDVLQLSRAAGRGEGIGLSGLHGNLAPLCLLEARRAVDGHAALIELLAVAEHVLRDLAQVDVQLAAVLRGGAVLTRIYIRIEHPELHVLDVSLLEVGRLQFAHHAAPAAGRILQRTVRIEVERQVVGAALLRIVSQVEHGQGRRGAVVGRLVAVGIELLDVDLADVVVRQLIQVALDVGRREARRAAGEDGVDVIPCQQGTSIAGGYRLLVVMSGEHRGHARQHPCLRVADVEQVLRILEVVQIGGIVLRAVALAGDELGKLARERDLRGLRAVQQGQAVEQVGQPLRLLLPVHVESPDGVVQRFLAHGHLGDEGLLLQV